MDDPGSWTETSATEASLPSPGRKSKGKAPLPPGEAKYAESTPSFHSADTARFNMEQKENLIDRDIELTVVLPGERTTTTIVNGSKPMMDLLIFLCGQYHLNPSTYTIDLISADKSQLKFKPNTPIGMLEVEKVVLKSKIMDDKNKKTNPVMPEQTVRVVINYKKTQKTVMRVSPHISLQDLIPSICSKCEFDPLHTVLLKDYQSQKPLDVAKSLNDLGLREIYAMDQSRATSPSDLKLAVLQESLQNVQMVETVKSPDDKGFFNFFRRSKKKRDQTASAPATPLLNKTRPKNVSRANTVSKSYDTNTLPSDVPRKRRAPLPPMHAPQSASNELSRGQVRTGSCIVKSVSVDDRDKALPGIERARTGSLQLSRSSFNSSLRRTKRKAPLPPSPPSKISQDQSDENSNEIARESLEVVHMKSTTEEESHDLRHPTVDVISECNLEEIEDSFYRKEECADAKPEEVSISSASTDVPLDTEIHNSSVVSDIATSSKSSEEELMITDSKAVHCKTVDTVTENTTLEYENNGHRENGTSTQTSVLEDNIQVLETKAINTDLEYYTLPDHQHHENNNSVFQNNAQVQIEKKENLDQTGAEKGKMQDSAVQTVSFYNGVEINAGKEFSHSQDSYLATFSGTDYVEYAINSKSALQPPSTFHQVELYGQELDKQEPVDPNNKIPSAKESVHTQTLGVKENTVESSQLLLSKRYQLYKQNSEPKPKPSNEITREYLPKIGMTTYKIVPQRSFDIERFEHESSLDINNSVSSPLKDYELLSHTANTNKSMSPLGNIECNELSSVMKNGKHGPQNTTHVIDLSMVSKNSAETNQKEHFVLMRSNSSAPILKTDKSSSPEFKPIVSTTSPVKNPSSFYLQMQRRASSMYVTSAIAKSSNSSTSASNNAVKCKEKGKDTFQPTIKTVPCRMDTVHFPSKLDDKLSELTFDDKQMLTEKHSVAKNMAHEPICERRSEVEHKINISQTVVEKHSVSTINVCEEHPELVQDKKPNEALPTSADEKLSELVQSETINEIPVTTIAEKPYVVHYEKKHEEVPSTSPRKTLRSLSSSTAQSVPLSLQKLRTFATPRPFLSSNPSPFAAAVSSAVKRSQSFSCSSTLVKQPLRLDSPAGWSPVASPTEVKNHSSPFSGISQEQSLEERLTPVPSELKYKVHSTPVLEKKTAVSFQSSDPEQIRQSLLTAIRSGEAAANLKRITVRSNTISINGRSRLSHPVFSETQHEL
ncbi:hypothetical protein FKM82_015583 [Ascaphus truei]